MDNQDKNTTATGSVTPIGSTTRNEAHTTIDKLADKAQPAADKTAASVHSAVEKLADKAQPAVDKAATTVHGTVDKLAEKVPAAADRLVGKAHETVDKVSDNVNNLSDTLGQKAADLNVAYNRLAETGRSYVRKSPGVSVLVALAAGYAVSKLLGSRRH